ncbi:hypothetical protein SSX86_010128 [Deinandra increscens subsp. villosa]|uniref:TIR domain-containing protein n=1 Tax=Deinandra increscens subsp. villosa TaxID=3103831 RepID=A0AAP0H264_9ASTR
MIANEEESRICKFLTDDDVSSDGLLYLPSESVVDGLINHMNGDLKKKFLKENKELEVVLHNKLYGITSNVTLEYHEQSKYDKRPEYVLKNFDSVVNTYVLKTGYFVEFEPRVGSYWCLEELAYIMKCRDQRGLIVMPIFLNVDPSEVRNQKTKFREAFAKQEAENATKAELWRKTLVWQMLLRIFFFEEAENATKAELWGKALVEHLPNLKVLELKFMEKLTSTPDFDGLPRLQKLTLGYCDELEEIHPSFGNHLSLEHHAYDEEHPIEDYDTLSLNAISYAARLPLTLKVLGSFLYDKDKKGWMSTLARLKDIPEMETMEKLKISYDGLNVVEKELFLDIACFFKGKHTYEAMEIFEACDFHPEIGIEVLRQKSLVTIVDDRLSGSTFDMHDLVEEMGHYIIRGKHPKNPRKHSRAWKHEEIKNMCLEDAITENYKIEALTYDGYSDDDSSRLIKTVSNMKKLRWLSMATLYKDCDEGPTLSNDLRYIKWDGYPARSPFSDSFQPMKLVVLKLSFSMQKDLWQGCKHLPHLKVLELRYMKKLTSTPSFDGLPCLQKLTLFCCDELEEIHPSLGDHTSLEYLCVSGCRNLLELPDLPSSLAILEAEYCYSLSTIVDAQKNCKLLCQVSLIRGAIINDGGKLLQSMLEGKAIENGCLILQLEGVEVAKEFRLHLVRERRCRLELPENWCNDFSGFLMCAVFTDYQSNCVRISMYGLDTKDDVMWEESDSESQDDVIWEEPHCDDYTSTWTWVGYVSFDSLRVTTWWDQTHKVLSFNTENKHCSGFGVRLVGKTSKIGLRKKPTAEYTPMFKIKDDSVTGLVIALSFYGK